MNKKPIIWLTLILALLLAGAALAQTTDFESFSAGSVHYQGPGSRPRR